MAPKPIRQGKIESAPAIGKNTTQTAQVVPPTDVARNQIASRYVYSFLGIIAFYVVVGLWNKYDTDQLKDGLLAISGVLSGPLGFIIGYYFKTNTEK